MLKYTKFGIFVFLLGLTFGLQPVPLEAAEQNSAYDRVIKTGEIKCGFGTYAPYITFNAETTEVEGIIVDVVEALAKNLDLNLVWGEETGWGNLPTSLKNGRVDLACSTLYRDPKRGKLVAFAEPIFYQASHVFVREDDERLLNGGIEALNSEDVTFSMQDGGFSRAVVERKFPKAKHNSLPQISNWSDVMLNVATGKADAIILDPVFISEFNKNSPKKLKRVPLPEPIAVFGNSFAVGIQETQLKEMIDTAVKYMHQTGEVEEITKEFRAKYPEAIILPKKRF